MNTMKTDRKKFIAFYSEFSYWAGQKIQLPKSNVDKFKEKIYCPVFIYENEFYTLCFCHMGLIMLHVVGLETDEDEILKDYEEIWKLERELKEHEKAGNEKGVELVVLKANPLLQEREKSCTSIESEITKWEKYLSILNSLYFVLTSFSGKLSHVARWSTQPIGIMDVTRLIIRDCKFEMYSQESISATNRVFQAYKTSGALSSPEYWEIVPKTTFDEIDKKFSVVASTPRLAQRLAQLLKASNEYENHNFTYALLLAWLIIESVIMDKWETYLHKCSNTTPEKKRNSVFYN